MLSSHLRYNYCFKVEKDVVFGVYTIMDLIF